MFYTYRQNNSGGVFVINDNVAQFVIVEAASAEEADTIAERHGIYFEGVDNGFDCPCCGDRWYTADEGIDSNETPLIYEKPPEEYLPFRTGKGQLYCHVYYLDGTKKTHRVPE